MKHKEDSSIVGDILKKLVKDSSLPKELVTGLTKNVRGVKEDLANGMREEVKKYLSHLDLEGMLRSLVEDYDIDVSAKFSFKRKRGRRKKNSTE